ncbi:hypothetical protein [Taibaiella soli]|nr:hypothetical protein [Taibaiella soli]
MKIMLAFLGTLYASIASGQTNVAKPGAFRISLTTYNHAAYIFEGATTYSLTDSSIQIAKKGLSDTAIKTVYLRPLENRESTIASINRIPMDTLKDYYCNYCIMITSGNEYFLSFEHNSKQKRIDLHHYYLPQLDEIIEIINSNLPAEYQIRYLDKNTIQDCKYSYGTEDNK